MSIEATIISQDIDNNGNIRVWSVHKIDGVEVESKYPKIDGHFVYATRYSKQNFLGMDKVGVENYILDDIKNHSNSLVQNEFDKKAPKTFRQIQIDYNSASNQDFATINLDKIVGKNISVSDVMQQIDADNDGIMDKTIILKLDGTKTEVTINA